MLKKGLLFGIALSMAVVMACGGDSKAPVSPSPTATADADAAADGSTLKVSAPVQQSPATGTLVDSITPNLVIANSTGKFVSPGTLTYRFSVETTGGSVVYTSDAVGAGAALTGHRVVGTVLGYETSYRWRARAESGTSVGPWSGYWTFTTPAARISPDKLPSYQKSNELWDNLADGKTIGSASGGVQFIPGRGALFPSFESRITYTMGTTMTSGAMEWMIENLDPDSDGGKTKVVAMQQGYGEFADNVYRFNVEKRGDDHADVGKFRLRIITGNAAEGAFADSDRWPMAGFSASKTYHMRVTWGSGVVRFTVREGSPKNPAILDNAFTYKGTYRPSPHVVHIGVPVPRGGPTDATVPGMIVRYFHVSDGTAAWPGTPLSTTLAEFGEMLGFKTPGSL